MPRVELGNPSAVSMEDALTRAFASFGRPPLGVGGTADGWSRLSTFQRCPYAYYLGYVREVQRIGPGPKSLEIGSLVHAALACHYARALPAGRVDLGWAPVQISPLDLIARVRDMGADARNCLTAEACVSRYLETWNPDDDFEPLAVEYPAGAEGIHTCRYDMIARWRGETWIIEHKTASRPTIENTDGWFLDGEILGEMWAWRLCELEKQFGYLAGVCVNMLYKGKDAPRRIQVVVPQNVLDGFIADRAYWSQQRSECAIDNEWPRKLQGCKSQWGLCSYWQHCRDGAPVESLPLATTAATMEDPE